jgi:hypothetical protein
LYCDRYEASVEGVCRGRSSREGDRTVVVTGLHRLAASLPLLAAAVAVADGRGGTEAREDHRRRLGHGDRVDRVIHAQVGHPCFCPTVDARGGNLTGVLNGKLRDKVTRGDTGGDPQGDPPTRPFLGTVNESEIFGRMLGEAAAKEAFTAFMDKRLPDFSKL